MYKPVHEILVLMQELEYAFDTCTHKTREDPRISVRGFVFLVNSSFYKGPYDPPSRSNWTQGVQLLLERGVCTSNFKENYITPCDFPGGWGGGVADPLSPL